MIHENTKINHLAIIMDGNSRWARGKNLTTAEGHESGAENAKAILPRVLELGIPYLTLYAFSSENRSRAPDEINVLMNLFSHYLENETKTLMDDGIRLKVLGRLDYLNKDIQARISNVVAATKDNTKMTLCIAFNYGGRLEIVDACNAIIKEGKGNIDENEFAKYLYDSEMPDVDLLIRTSGTHRISNFLLWQSAYAELYFCDKNWPDFAKEDLIEAVNDYAKRNRTFGIR